MKVPLISPNQINTFLNSLTTLLNKYPCINYIITISLTIFLCGLIAYTINKISKLDTKILVESNELLISMWASITASLFIMAIIFFLLVSKEVATIIFYFRGTLKNISNASILISICLTIPLIKKETLQTFMCKVFLEDNSLEKPYRRFCIFGCIFFGVILEKLISLYIKNNILLSNFLALFSLQVLLLIGYFFIRSNFYFFFGDLDYLDNPPKKKITKTPTAIIRYSYEGVYNRVLRGSYIFGYTLINSLFTQNIFKINFRNVGEDPYPTFKEAQNSLLEA